MAVMKAITNAIIMHSRVSISNADFSDSINLRTKASKNFKFVSVGTEPMIDDNGDSDGKVVSGKESGQEEDD